MRPRLKSLVRLLMTLRPLLLIALSMALLQACDVRVLISSSLENASKQIGENDPQPPPSSPPPPSEPEVIETNDSILAELSGLPTQGSGNNSLTISVSGTNVTQYRYKFGSSVTTDCQSSTGYSGSLNISQWIEDSLVTYFTESLKICVVGINDQGQMQPYALATEYVWSRNVVNRVFVAQSGLTLTEESAPTVINFTIRALYPAVLPIVIDYDFYGDVIETFSLTSGQATIMAGQSSVTVSVPIMATPAKNTDSYLRLGISKVSATGGYSDFMVSSVYLIDLERVTSRSIQSVSPNMQCAVLDNGHLICTGRIGTLNTSDQRYASGWKRVGAPTLFKSIINDDRYRCAINVTDEMYCWGWGFDGQLGLGTNSDHGEPQLINGLQWRMAASYGNVMCGISTSDDLYCWGDQTYTKGLAGNGLTSDQRSPLNIDPSLKYEKVFLTQSTGTACAISKPEGILKCWGANGFNYKLGDGTTTDRSSPVIIDAGESYQDIAFSSQSTCGLTTAGFIKCWGANLDQSSSTTVLTTPTLIDNSRVYTKIAMERYSYYSTVCALSEGRPYCYGSIAGLNQNQMTLMDHSPDVYLEIALDGLMCGKTTDQRIKCWGGTTEYHNSIFTKYYKYSGAAHWSLDTFTNLFNTQAGICGITTLGQLKCALHGSSMLPRNFGSFSHPTPSVQVGAVKYETTLDFLDIALKCLIKSTDYSLSCWGSSNYVSRIAEGLEFKQLGSRLFYSEDLYGIQQNGTLTSIDYYDETITIVDPGVSYSDISVQGTFGCGITQDTSTVKCWGGNSNGQLGVGDTVDRETPTPISLAEPFLKVVADSGTSGAWVCALSTNLALYCWGRNTLGLGTGITNSTTPVEILPGTRFTDFGVKSNTACAIRESDGRVLCWGRGTTLGVNSTSNRSTPDVTSDTDPYLRIYGGGFDSTFGGFCGVTASETKCWGTYPDGLSDIRIPTVVLNQPAALVKWSNSVLYLKGNDGKLYVIGNTNHLFGEVSILIGFEPLLGLYDSIIPDWSP